MTQPCKITGPYLPVGDVDYVCLTHDGVICELQEGPHHGVSGLSKADMRCPVADPRSYDPPLEYAL